MTPEDAAAQNNNHVQTERDLTTWWYQTFVAGTAALAFFPIFAHFAYGVSWLWCLFGVVPFTIFIAFWMLGSLLLVSETPDQIWQLFDVLFLWAPLFLPLLLYYIFSNVLAWWFTPVLGIVSFAMLSVLCMVVFE